MLRNPARIPCLSALPSLLAAQLLFAAALLLDGCGGASCRCVDSSNGINVDIACGQTTCVAGEQILCAAAQTPQLTGQTCTGSGGGAGGGSGTMACSFNSDCTSGSCVGGVCAGSGGGSGSVTGTSNGHFTLAVDEAERDPRIGTVGPGAGHVLLSLAVTLANTGESMPVHNGFPLYSLTSTDQLIYPASSLSALATPVCTSGVAIGIGGHISCRVVFEIPSGAVPSRLDYSDGTRTASVDLGAVSVLPHPANFIQGTALGVSFPDGVADAESMVARGQCVRDGLQHSWTVVTLSDQPGWCAAYLGAGYVPSASTLSFGVELTGAALPAIAPPGTYSLTSSYDAGGFSVTPWASLYQVDSTCNVTGGQDNGQVVSGTITITASSLGAVAGSFDLTFAPNGEELTGTFSTSACAVSDLDSCHATTASTTCGVPSSPISAGPSGGDTTPWTWKSVAGSDVTSVGIRPDGTLWNWGAISSGSSALYAVRPYQVGTDSDWASASVGAGSSNTATQDGHLVAIKANGTLWAWGSNSKGQFGNGTTSPSRTDTPVQVGTDSDWKLVSAGEYYTLALKTNGSLWGWGQNVGQLADGTYSSQHLTPFQIGANITWASVSAGADHVLALDTDGALYVWGLNAQGQLGTGDNNPRFFEPTLLGTGYKAVSAGYQYSMALKSDGTLWAFGDNSSGELGIGSTNNANAPVEVGGNYAAVIAGANDTLAIQTDGTLRFFGVNSVTGGQATFATSPTQLGTRSDWKQLGASWFHGMALDASGRLWEMGQNGDDFGNGVYTDSFTLVQGP